MFLRTYIIVFRYVHIVGESRSQCEHNIMHFIVMSVGLSNDDLLR